MDCVQEQSEFFTLFFKVILYTDLSGFIGRGIK